MDKITTTKLNIEPSEALQRKLISTFWRKEEDQVRTEDFISFFYYYNTTCRALYLGFTRTESAAIILETHEDVLTLMEAIWSLSDRSKHNFTRPGLRDFLSERRLFADEPQSKINNSIDFVLRLWLTIRIQEADFAPASKTRQWDDTTTIQSFISALFPGPTFHDASGRGTIESNFTAVNLNSMCGIRIEWIHQLEDHLHYDLDRRVLMVYSLPGCLQGHLDSKSPLPASLTQETLLTLSILFPTWDLRTTRLLRNTPLSSHPLSSPSYAHLNAFHHWRDRLARIHQEFQSPGPGWRHLWSDRRNALQWYTFWFAVAILVLTVAFGSAGLVLSSLQTWYTYQGLLLAREQAGL